VGENLNLLTTYRDNAIHFYNEEGFRTVLYALLQTCIVNFRDLLDAGFDLQLSDEISWALLPLGLRPPIQPVDYLSQGTAAGTKAKPAVFQFLNEIIRAKRRIEAAGSDTGRLLTEFRVNLVSVKKVGAANVQVAVASAGQSQGPLVVRHVDPNVSHPLKQRDVLTVIATINGTPFTSHVLQAIVWKHEIRSRKQFCWRSSDGYVTKYSNDFVEFIKRLTKADVEAAVSDYRAYAKARKQKGKQ